MNVGGTQAISVWQWVTLVAVSAFSGLAGVLVGSWLSRKREASQRRHSFVERQLREFYSPLLGIRSEIQALGQVSVKVSKTGNAVWRAHCDRYRTAPNVLAEWCEKHKDEYTADIEYNNRQFEEVLLPAYKRMVVTFRENLWLAEIETRVYFAKLVEFVDLWVRWLEHTIPALVMREIDLRESELLPFYEHLAVTHDELQRRLKSGEA
jgi:hypothetical protein